MNPTTKPRTVIFTASRDYRNPSAAAKRLDQEAKSSEIQAATYTSMVTALTDLRLAAPNNIAADTLNQEIERLRNSRNEMIDDAIQRRWEAGLLRSNGR